MTGVRARRFSVIVVGAGSGGATMAARLSEHPELEVSLFEAGPDHRAGQTPPSISGPSFVEACEEPGRTWPGLMATRVRGQESRPYRRGRGVGGSSAVNAMVALPGTADDYDEWERVHGCAGWAWRDVAPWFRRTALSLHRAPSGEWGPLNRLVGECWPDAAEGVLLTRDPAGRRVSVNDAYLEPARGRPNLSIHGDSHVERILLDGRRAIGVVVDGREVPADLVVVGAGAIHSPALLLRSGVEVDGLGQGLCDHPSFPVSIALRESAVVGSLPIATVARLPGREGRDDLQILPIEYVDAGLPNLAVVMAAAMRVHSRGSVSILDPDPWIEPTIDFDLLSDERDIEAVHSAIDALERLLEHPGIDRVGTPLPFDRSDAGVRSAIGDYVHAAGTCAMGRVVDTVGRVVGYDALMVCDASVLPSLPRANTHLPTVMVAERLAAFTRSRLESAGSIASSGSV